MKNTYLWINVLILSALILGFPLGFVWAANVYKFFAWTLAALLIASSCDGEMVKHDMITSPGRFWFLAIIHPIVLSAMGDILTAGVTLICSLIIFAGYKSPQES